MLFQKFTLGLKMQPEPGHSPSHHPSGKPGDCSTGCLGLQSAQADALMTQTERIKSIHLRPGKKGYSWEHQSLRNQTHKAAAKTIQGVTGGTSLNHGHSQSWEGMGGPGDIRRGTSVSCDPQGHYTGQDTSPMSSAHSIPSFQLPVPVCTLGKARGCNGVCLHFHNLLLLLHILGSAHLLPVIFLTIFFKGRRETETITKIPVHDILEKLQEGSGNRGVSLLFSIAANHTDGPQ